MIGFLPMAVLLGGIYGCVYALIKLQYGKQKNKDEHSVVKTKKDLQNVVTTIRRLAVELQADIGQINDPLKEFGTSNDLAVVLHGQINRLDEWAVQIYATETGRGCEIELVALGEGLAGRCIGGVYTGRINLSGSRKWRDIIASRLY